MTLVSEYLIFSEAKLEEILSKLESITPKVLFVTDNQNRLLGSITDGDVRRGLLKGNKILTAISRDFL